MIPLFVNYNKEIKEIKDIKEIKESVFNLFNLFRIDFQSRTQKPFG